MQEDKQPKQYKRVYMVVTSVEYEGYEIPEVAFETEQQANEYMRHTVSRAYTSRSIYPLDVELNTKTN